MKPSAIFRVGAFAILVTGTGYLVGHAYVADQKSLFYPAVVALSASIFLMVRTTRLREISGLGMTSRICLLFALLLPIADWVYQLQPDKPVAVGPPDPAYSFRAAKGNPEAFSAWWVYYTNEWTKPDGAQAQIQAPDPQGTLPYVLAPNTRGRFFQHTYHINNLGFNGDDFEPEKINEYRIFAIGDSPVFDTLMQDSDRAWVDMLQSSINTGLTCDRPIRVINAGLPGSSIRHSLELFRRRILPLKPDLALIYNATGSLTLIGTEEAAAPTVPRRAVRASALVGELEYRWLHWRYVRAQRQQSQTIFSKQDADNSVFAGLFRELIQLSQENKTAVVLATASMAVTAQSPSEVIDFYGRAFANIDWLIFAVDIQNELLSKLAQEAGVPLIDTRPGMAGEWDSDLFVDVVHFTRKGANRLARRMFDGLVPVLEQDPALRCATKPASASE